MRKGFHRCGICGLHSLMLQLWIQNYFGQKHPILETYTTLISNLKSEFHHWARFLESSYYLSITHFQSTVSQLTHSMSYELMSSAKKLQPKYDVLINNLKIPKIQPNDERQTSDLKLVSPAQLKRHVQKPDPFWLLIKVTSKNIAMQKKENFSSPEGRIFSAGKISFYRIASKYSRNVPENEHSHNFGFFSLITLP